MMTALVALFAFVASASAMSYEQARQQALFLTDKMAYELNLTEEQYEAAYEVNLRTSIAPSTGAQATGTSASTPAIRTATTSISECLASIAFIVVATHGT